MSGRVEGRVAIVTGAGSVTKGIGNGRAAATLYAREGARVLLVDKDPQAARETEALIVAEGGTCATVQADVSQVEECRRVVDTCVRAYGRIDILHNNVGIEIPGGLAETTVHSWETTMAVNLKSVFLMCKYAIAHMERQRRGAVINISSINAIRTLPALSLPYGVSKAGIIALTREIAVEYAAKGIRVNAILPGMLDTPFATASLSEAYGGDVDRMRQRRNALCPTGKQGEGWDVANVALFLASDEAKYITGAAIVVDGGQTCRIFSPAKSES